MRIGLPGLFGLFELLWPRFGEGEAEDEEEGILRRRLGGLVFSIIFFIPLIGAETGLDDEEEEEAAEEGRVAPAGLLAMDLLLTVLFKVEIVNNAPPPPPVVEALEG